MDLIVMLLVILIVLALVGSLAVSPLLWVLVIILVVFAVGGRRPLPRTARVIVSLSTVDPSDGLATSTGIRLDHLHLWLGSSSLGRRVGHNPQYTPGRPPMGEKTDKISGRAKQAVGAVTGDEKTKREGQRQEDKGKLKGKLDSVVDKRHAH